MIFNIIRLIKQVIFWVYGIKYDYLNITAYNNKLLTAKTISKNIRILFNVYICGIMIADIKKTNLGKYMLRLKTTVTVLVIVSSLNTIVCNNTVLKKDNADSINKQFITSDFKNEIFAGILLRENHTSRKATHPTDPPKPFVIAFNCSSFKNSTLHTGDYELSNTALNVINQYNLLTLHCLLTI